MALTARARANTQPAHRNLGDVIDDFYTPRERAQDFAGLPDRVHPQRAKPRKAYRDPLAMPVAESPEMALKRRKLQLMHSFKVHCDKRERIETAEIDQETPRYPALLAPLKVEIDEWQIDLKAEQAKHNAWLAKERADMEQRRMMANIAKFRNISED